MRNSLFACFLALPFLWGCGGNKDDGRPLLEQIRSRGELVIGTEPEFAPFESKNEKGEFVGFDMDMARELAKDLGVKLRIEEMAWASLPTALENKRIDLIISGMTATPERAKVRAFTEPYFRTGLCLLVSAKSDIQKPEDVDGKRLVVKLGTTGDINALRLFPGCEGKITKLETEGACALEVINGRADAFLYDQISVLKHNRANPKTTRALLRPLTKEPYAMATRLGEQAFVDRLNEFLRTIRKDGRYEALRKKYLSGIPDDPR